ncbi:L-histidine N(alpha)-methyltransferase [Flavobacterium sp. MXW15]|uniref:L-histidine N(Alpha)-methyltransferase n=1 Tax=Xanthomonas chitinilytica TaxID=2989819 RepID=A0ABT3JXJ3_9XANT|nr:L-histidine N(alpha)-methyltransferase [Xanthomonas sp. H13-6]MCW4455374.1 L-histidine N(alpha)-methyltransferase [Flavobacterium sp. MXW15]MCW4473201.1 L-histidine N(alpha)-methyltransferase [Xanthomonas sp. H13-6]
MNAAAQALAALTDLLPGREAIAAEVLAGLSRHPRRLPSKYFYDERGSALFEQITRQPEYYLTRTELALLQRVLPDIARQVGAHARVVEYGSGSGRKTRLLLHGLDRVVAYTPIEIARSALLASVAHLAGELPAVEMLPVCADFTAPVRLPAPQLPAARTLVFFPGSTLGNFTADEAVKLLLAMRQTMGPQGLALIGIDLDKAPDVIEAAYNDAAGVTAAFTLNLLARLNREIGSDFDLAQFQHRARYHRQRLRIETELVSRQAQTVHVAGQAFAFAAGEAMQVEYSHKYTEAGFAALAAAAGLQVVAGWDSEAPAFGLRLLQPA